MTGAYQFLKKYGLALSAGIGFLISILSYAFILGGYPEFEPTTKELYELSIFDFALYSTYFLMFVATVLVIVFPTIYVVKNPKESVRGLIGLGVFVGLYFIAHLMGDGTLTSELVSSDPSLMPEGAKFEEGMQSSDMKWIDGLLKFNYVLMFLSAMAMLFSAVRDLLKQK